MTALLLMLLPDLVFALLLLRELHSAVQSLLADLGADLSTLGLTPEMLQTGIWTMFAA